MAFFDSLKKGFNLAGSVMGDNLSKNAHNATRETIDGMKLFREKAAQTSNVDFEFAKGNLFEYIESAKFNKTAAMSGASVRSVVTDAAGDPHAAADILLKENGKTVREVQAKFSKTYGKNGNENSAASSVIQQAGGQKGHWGKYHGMDRLIRKDPNYNSDGSLLDEAKKIAGERGKSAGLYAKEYQDVHDHLIDELQYGDVKSDGTTYEEVEQAYKDPELYAKDMEKQQWKADLVNTSVNMAKTGAMTNGLVSGVNNMFLLFKDEKELGEALHDVGIDVVKGGVRGGATGVISTAIRYQGTKIGSTLLTDSTAATIMAGGIIDGGVALYAYAKGEINGEELVGEIVNTTAKSVTTVYFTKAVTAVVGTANPFLPMAIYTAASYVTTCTREIIRNAKLNAKEAYRMKALLDESTMLMKEYHQKMLVQLDGIERKQRMAMDRFLDTFTYNIETGENYDLAINSIVAFANQTGIALQHVKFSDFDSAMMSDDDFILG